MHPPLLHADSSVPPPPFPPPPPDAKLGPALIAALAVVGVLQFALSWTQPLRNAEIDGAAYRFGVILGATLVWPLIVVGLFSIFRRFRNGRSRAIIVLSVWGVFILAHLGQLSTARAHRRFNLSDSQTLEKLFQTRDALPVEAASREVPLTPPRPPVAAVAASPEFDFSPGSHERLIKHIGASQEERYHAVLNAYDQACTMRSQDALLALERVRFIEFFAYSEDIAIESAGNDLERAVEALKRDFPQAPEAVLYQLENIYNVEFDAIAQRHALHVATWPPADRARFYLLRANAASQKAQTRQVRLFAERSFAAQPTAESALLLAQQAQADGKAAECLKYLETPAFDSANAWTKKQKMDLLLTLGATEQALAIYDDLAASFPATVSDPELAAPLARAGRVEAARALLANVVLHDWNRDEILRQRFRFELEFGTAVEATAAYRLLRDTGLSADPVLRQRLVLFRHHPGAGWNTDDVIGLLFLVLLFGAMAFAPFVLLAPIHYWSLLRQRRRGAFEPRSAGWGLQQAWIALGVMFVAEMAAIWVLQPDWMQTWWNDRPLTNPASERALLTQHGIVWAATAAVLCLLLWGADKWPLLGRGRWSGWKNVGIALGATLVLRIFLLGYAVIWPQAVYEPIATADSQTRLLCISLLNAGGPLALIAAVAVLVPLVEELLFRGVLLQALTKHITFGWANLVQSLAFAAVHENYRIFPFYVAFGLLAGFLTRRSNSLLAAILLHGFNNLLVCLGLITLRRYGLL